MRLQIIVEVQIADSVYESVFLLSVVAYETVAEYGDSPLPAPSLAVSSVDPVLLARVISSARAVFSVDPVLPARATSSVHSQSVAFDVVSPE